MRECVSNHRMIFTLTVLCSQNSCSVRFKGKATLQLIFVVL